MKIAITGTIGSGKSTVSRYLVEKGFEVFDCDESNRNLLKKNHKGYNALKKTFNDAFDGEELNKKKLADIIFNSEDRRIQLEEIMHPFILKDMLNHMKDKKLFFAEVPLLFEKDWDEYFDFSVLVVCDEDIALQRLIGRGMEIEDGRRRLATQMPVQEKMQRCNLIIYNNGSLLDLYKEVDNWIKDIC